VISIDLAGPADLALPLSTAVKFFSESNPSFSPPAYQTRSHTIPDAFL
jgi:hypothetical protein